MTNQTDYFFKRTESFIDKEISLDHLDLKILALIEQNKSAREIGRELNISPAMLKLKITALHKHKVIKLVENYECMEKELLDYIKKELLELIGPMGSMVFDDVIESMRLRPDNIPKMIAKDIIHMISKELPDHDESIRFEKKMLEKLNGSKG